MKNVLIVALLALGFAGESFAASPLPGLKQNLVLTCGNGDEQVYVISEAYSTKGYGQLQGDPGRLMTVVGKTTFTPGKGFSMTMKGAPVPMSFQPTGFIDKTKGIYENGQFILDLRSRYESKIQLRVKANGNVLTCHIDGDCC